jgi:transposase
MPRSPGHAFYDRLQAELATSGFDSYVEGLCAAHHATRVNAEVGFLKSAG